MKAELNSFANAPADMASHQTDILTSRRTFLWQLGLGVAGIGAVCALPSESWAASARSLRLPRSVAEAEGVSSAGILNFVNAIDTGRLNVHSVMVVRHGKVIAEGWWAPYAPNLKHSLYSLSKSYTSTGVGLAASEGLLRLDDKVVSFFPQSLPASVSPNLAAMRVKDLLMMGSGHAKDALFNDGFEPAKENWVQHILAQPVEFEPGTHFVYNNAATYLLSAIVQKVTGQTLLAYLQRRLFGPLGIEGVDWETSPQGINTGAWGLRVKTEDIAKLGQLYLQKGLWNGQRLLPESWVDEATHKQIANDVGVTPANAQKSDWNQGYCYQFWRCRHEEFRGDGAFGQYCIVLPKEDAVIAMTAESNEMQGILNAVWTHLLPAMHTEALAADPNVQTQLKQKLASLALPIPVGQPNSPVAERVSGKKYAITDNSLTVQRVSLTFQKAKCVFTMKDAQGEHSVTCGLRRWVEGKTDVSTIPLHLVLTRNPDKAMKVMGAGAWSDENTFVMQWQFVETAHYDQVTCRFNGDDLTVEFKKSLCVISPGSKDKRPVLTGKMVV